MCALRQLQHCIRDEINKEEDRERTAAPSPETKPWELTPVMHGIPNSRIAKQVEGSSSLNLASSSQFHRSWHQRKLLLFPLRRFSFSLPRANVGARPPLPLTKRKFVFGPGPGPGTVCCRAFRSLTAQIIPKRRRDLHVILSIMISM